MTQPSRIDWGMIGMLALWLGIFLLGGAIGYTDGMKHYDLPPPTAELEISVEDMERIASMFAGEAKRIKDARMDALEARIEKLEEGK